MVASGCKMKKKSTGNRYTTIYRRKLKKGCKMKKNQLTTVIQRYIEENLKKVARLQELFYIKGNIYSYVMMMYHHH